MWENGKNVSETNEKPEVIEESERKEMTLEEKQDVKKQMIMLIWVVLIIIFGYVIINVVMNFIKSDEKEIEETVEEQEEVKEVLPDGEISINNKIIQEIDEMFKFDKRNPLYEENILKLFSDDRKEVDELDFKSKMLLITSNRIFNDYMINETNLKNYKTKEVTLTKKKLEELSKDIFGRDINLEHSNFKYYYVENNNVVYFDATLKEDKYIFTITDGKESSIEVYKKINYVYKIDTELYIHYNVLFLKGNNIYKDREFNFFITNNLNNINSYINLGNSYEFIYKIDFNLKNSYILEQIRKMSVTEKE